MIQLNYHHLYYFKTIATEGSISKAAEKLMLGQPTLSMQLKQFEEFLEHELFERRNRKLVLTEMGRLVLSYADQIFRLGDEMLDTVSGRPSEGQKRIHLSIGALDSVPKNLVRALMRRAYAVGDCHISVLEGQGPELILELREHRLDLVLSNASPPSLTGEKIFSRSLSKMPLFVWGAKRYATLKTNFPASLGGRPFILPTMHSRVRHEAEQFFEQHAIKVDVIAEAQDLSIMKALAVEGQGLIVASEPAVSEHIANGGLENLGPLRGHHEEIWLIASERKIQNPIAKELMREFSL